VIDDAHGVGIASLMEAARNAGAKILEIYGRDFEVEYKGDNSPLTEADKAANEAIMAFLERAYPEIPVISEENRAVPYRERSDWGRFWLVDPLDGTKEFIKKNGEFTVNIALVEGSRPILGVVYRPVDDILYLGVENSGAWRISGDGLPQPIEGGSHYLEKEQVRVVASRSHLSPEVEAFVKELRMQGKEVDFLSAGSSLKLCLVAEGAADVYPRFGPTMEWDTGAAQAVATAAGRRVLDVRTRKPLSYNKENLLNPHFIVE
jgi:3'(2'), 5'-bisphosphate nucleotidase